MKANRREVFLSLCFVLIHDILYLYMHYRKVLILGTGGTLGGALKEEFGKNGYEVLAWDRKDGDITSPDFLVKIKTIKPDVIINATGYNNVDKAEKEEKELAYKINAEAVGALANVAKEIGAVLINYSTGYVFDGEKESGYVEDDIPNPVSEYGKSKYEGEKLTQSAGGKHYIIRLSRLFGKRGTSLNSKPSFVDIMLSKKSEQEIKVVNEEISSLVYAPDLAKFTRALLEDKKPYGIYHCANAGACTWFEWAKEFFSLIGRGPKLIPVSASEFPRPAPRPKFCILLNTKMPALRGWGEALEEYLVNFQF